MTVRQSESSFESGEASSPMDASLGGLDVGGTKIDAKLFNADFEEICSRRIDTPTHDFETFIDALGNQIDWIRERARSKNVATGICFPGILSPLTGKAHAANLPIRGHDLQQALQKKTGQSFSLEIDGIAFTLSEATGGAASNAETTVGIVLGTGLGGGAVRKSEASYGHNGLGFEIGHIGAPAALVAQHDLPLWACGCGKSGCLEVYASGSAISKIARWKTGETFSGRDVVKRSEKGCLKCKAVLDIWFDFVCQSIYISYISHDPDMIVLGGGASNIENLVAELEKRLEPLVFDNSMPPKISLAQFGESSGARGAAIKASRAQNSVQMQ